MLLSRSVTIFALRMRAEQPCAPHLQYGSEPDALHCGQPMPTSICPLLQVSAAGLAALRAAGVELVPVPPAAAAAAPAGGRGTAPAPSRAQSVASSSGQLAVGTPAQAAGGAASLAPATSSGGMSSMLPKSWQPKSWRSSSNNSGGGGGGSSAGTTTLLGSGGRQLAPAQSLAAPAGSSGGSGPGSPNPSPGSGTYTRPPFVLRRTPDAGDSTHLPRSFSKESGESRLVGCLGVV